MFASIYGFLRASTNDLWLFIVLYFQIMLGMFLFFCIVSILSSAAGVMILLFCWGDLFGIFKRIFLVF